MQEAVWLINETKPPTERDLRQLERELPTDPGEVVRARGRVPYLAIMIHDVVIHNIKKLLGGAEIRLDTLVVSGTKNGKEILRICTPTTLRFPDVRKGDRLPIDTGGLLIYHGKPEHFLDISILASRNRTNDPDLAAILLDHLNSPELQAAVDTVSLVSSVAVPQAAIVMAGARATIMLGSMVHRILQAVTGGTLGLYRTSWLHYRDDFGIGRHPAKGTFQQQDFSFWYEIVEDKPPDSE